jgi:hypothetical protein
MDILITQWALDSYLDLKRDYVFSEEEYKTVIRPDVMHLHHYPNDPKFSQGKFWSIAQGTGPQNMGHAFKMKWHQVGNGKIQLRLTVAIFDRQCFLCEAYVKHNAKQDVRKLLRFKTYLQLIRENRYSIRGILT